MAGHPLPNNSILGMITPDYHVENVRYIVHYSVHVYCRYRFVVHAPFTKSARNYTLKSI